MKILTAMAQLFLREFGIETAFQKLNVEYDILFYQQTDWEKHDGIVETLEQKSHGSVCPGVFCKICTAVAEVRRGFYMSWFADARFTSGNWRH